MKILLCCGGGFSSSYLAQKMKNEIIEKQLENEVSIEFFPFTLVDELIDQYDIVMCCPHLNIEVQRYCKNHDVTIPIYLLPPKMYGRMTFDALYQDAKDICGRYSQQPMNPFHFPGEEKLLRIQRYLSYQETHQKNV